MIIYGTKGVHVKSEEKRGLTCPTCGEKGEITLSIFRKHVHVFWIPIFPYSKIVLSECGNCKSVLKKKEMPEAFRHEYDLMKDNVKGPLWQFAGLVLIAILFMYIKIDDSQKNKLELEYLSEPKSGDVYEYKPKDESGYSTLKVVMVTSDSVFVQSNIYVTNLLTGLDEIEKPENYSEGVYGFSKEEIKVMYDDNDIYNVKRSNTY